MNRRITTLLQHFNRGNSNNSNNMLQPYICRSISDKTNTSRNTTIDTVLSHKAKQQQSNKDTTTYDDTTTNSTNKPNQPPTLSQSITGRVLDTSAGNLNTNTTIQTSRSIALLPPCKPEHSNNLHIVLDMVCVVITTLHNIFVVITKQYTNNINVYCVSIYFCVLYRMKL